MTVKWPRLRQSQTAHTSISFEQVFNAALILLFRSKFYNLNLNSIFMFQETIGWHGIQKYSTFRSIPVLPWHYQTKKNHSIIQTLETARKNATLHWHGHFFRQNTRTTYSRDKIPKGKKKKSGRHFHATTLQNCVTTYFTWHVYL